MRSASTCTCGTSSPPAWRRRTRCCATSTAATAARRCRRARTRWSELVDDAARVIREWGRGPVAWIGLSMGGMVGQGLAILHPELLQRRGARQHHRALSRSRRRDLGGAHRRGRAGRHGRPSPTRWSSATSAPTTGPTHPAETAALKAKLLRMRSGRLRRLLPRDRQGRLARPPRRGAHADAGHRRRQGRRRDAGDGAGDRRAHRRRRARAVRGSRRTSASPSCRIASTIPWRLFSHRSECPFPPSRTRS